MLESNWCSLPTSPVVLLLYFASLGRRVYESIIVWMFYVCVLVCSVLCSGECSTRIYKGVARFISLVLAFRWSMCYSRTRQLTRVTKGKAGWCVIATLFTARVNMILTRVFICYVLVFCLTRRQTDSTQDATRQPTNQQSGYF